MGLKGVASGFYGAWAVEKNAAGAARVKLYGRRHLIATTWRPYQGKSERETTRVAGGALSVTPVKSLDLAGLKGKTGGWSRSEGGPGCERLAKLDAGAFV